MRMRMILASVTCVFFSIQTSLALAEPVLLEAPHAPADEHGERDDLNVSLALGPTLLSAYDAPVGDAAAMTPRGMVLSQLALDLPFATTGASVWGFEIAGRFGVVPSAGETALVGIVLGLRLAAPLIDGLDATFGVRLAHIHDAPHAAWTGDTGATLAGDPSHGLAHITAGGGAIGVAWEVPGTDRRLVFSAQIEALGRVHGHGSRALPNVWLSLPIGLAWRV